MNEIISENQKQEWRKIYLSNRYLSSFSVHDLEKRLDDILKNLLVFSKDGSPSFDQSSPRNGLLKIFIHLEEELSKRDISIDLKTQARKHSEKYQHIVKALNLSINRKLVEGKYLVIFGLKKHFEQTIKYGKIQIKPASAYDDCGLIESVRDDELSQKLILPKGTKLRMKNFSGEFEELRAIGNISTSNRYPTNFYIYCMSTTYQPRLFDDFKADSCIFVYDYPMFQKKILKYLKTHYSDWLVGSKIVRYFDPINTPDLLDLPFNKHFRYWYQSEFRIVFKPSKPVNKLEIIYPEIGSLNNCCELVHL